MLALLERFADDVIAVYKSMAVATLTMDEPTTVDMDEDKDVFASSYKTDNQAVDQLLDTLRGDSQVELIRDNGNNALAEIKNGSNCNRYGTARIAEEEDLFVIDERIKIHHMCEDDDDHPLASIHMNCARSSDALLCGIIAGLQELCTSDQNTNEMIAHALCDSRARPYLYHEPRYRNQQDCPIRTSS